MKIKGLLIFAVLIINLSAYSQSYFGKSFTVGTSLTYLGDHDKFTYYNHDEFTWNLNTSMRISKRVQLGVQALSIYSNGGNTEYVYHNLLGCFTQVDALTRDNVRIFGELSFNRGDYLSSRKFLYPKKQEGLYYLGWGGGTEVQLPKIHKQLYLDLSFIAYLIFNPVERKYGYTQYIVGLNYKFGKGHK